MKKYENAKMDDSELDQVAGGTIIETMSDSVELYKRGLLNSEYEGCSAVRKKLHSMGYTGYEDKGGIINDNVYTDKNGNTLSRAVFCKNFDAENGNKVIR